MNTQNKNKITVVYTDDYEGLIQTMEACLPACITDREFAFYSGKDGNALVELVLAHKPEIIITDDHMPEKDGSDAIREIRERHKITTPIILISGETSSLPGGISKVYIMKKPYGPSGLNIQLREAYPDLFT